MNNPSTYLIHHRPFTTYTASTKTLRDRPKHNILFDLNYLGVMNIIGAKGHDFLQGQLSCDVREVTAEYMRPSALCDLKGRVLMLPDVLEWNEGLHLILPHDLIPAARRLLAKPAALSRVTLEHATNYDLFGFLLNNPNDLLPFNGTLPTAPLSVSAHEDGCCYAQSHNAYVFIVNKSHREAFTLPFKQHPQQWQGSLAWHAQRLLQKKIEIYPESSGLFLPHRLDLQHTGYLNFNKGCYKGQEIIARMHYRSTAKHTLKSFKITYQEPLYAGLRFYLPKTNTEIGELVDFCPINDHEYIIAASLLFEHPIVCYLGDQEVTLHALDTND